VSEAATFDELYAQGLAGDDLWVRYETGAVRPLPVCRWLATATDADQSALDRTVAPVLDVGCGPGRNVLALARRGVLAVGIDVAPAAVRHARQAGAAAVLADVFERVPAAGRWGSALLLDGNIGIGGRPDLLLRRLASLLRENGRIVCECSGPGHASARELIHLEGQPGRRSAWFGWARVGIDDVDALADRVQLQSLERWEVGGRWFALLAPRSVSEVPIVDQSNVARADALA